MGRRGAAKQMGRGALVVATLVLAMLPDDARAQVGQGLELYLGPGYFSSPSGRQLSKPTIEVGATFWFGPSWGLGGSYGVATSDDLLDEPELLGPTHVKLRFYRVMVERRFPVSPNWDVRVGVGVLQGLHTRLWRDPTSGSRQRVESTRGFGYLNFEMMARWRVRGRFGLRGGVDVSIPLVVRASVLASLELG